MGIWDKVKGLGSDALDYVTGDDEEEQEEKQEAPTPAPAPAATAPTTAPTQSNPASTETLTGGLLGVSAVPEGSDLTGSISPSSEPSIDSSTPTLEMVYPVDLPSSTGNPSGIGDSVAASGIPPGGDIFGLPDTSGRQVGDVWYTTLPDGRTVRNEIPEGNGLLTVDQTITNLDGSTTISRVAADVDGSWQRWNNDSNGMASWASKDSPTAQLTGLHFNPGVSTSGEATNVFGMSADYRQTLTPSYDSNGNVVGYDVGIANSAGLYDNVHFDNLGNRTETTTARDAAGNLVSTFTGQIDSYGYGWRILDGDEWSVFPDSQGNQHMYRTELTEDGLHVFNIYPDGRRTDEFRGNNPGEWYRDTRIDGKLIRTDVHGENWELIAREGGGVIAIQQSTGASFTYDLSGNLVDKAVAPGTIDTLGAIETGVDWISPVGLAFGLTPGTTKGALNALAGAGIGALSLAGAFEKPEEGSGDLDWGHTLNLPNRETALTGLADLVLQTGRDGKAALLAPAGDDSSYLRFLNGVSQLTIGTDWSNFADHPDETLGSAAVGAGLLVVPGIPKIGKGIRIPGDLGEAGIRGAVPDQSWPALPERLGSIPDDGVLAGVGSPKPGMADRAWGAAQEAVEALRQRWAVPEEPWLGTGFGPGTPHRNQPMDGGGSRAGGTRPPRSGSRGDASRTSTPEPENFWDLVRPAGNGSYQWKKSGWYDGNWHHGGSFADLPKQDLHYNAKVVDKRDGVASLAETDPFVQARKVASDELSSYRKEMEARIAAAELETDIASITGGDRLGVFEDLAKNNPSKQAEIGELQASVQGYFDRENALVRASEDMGEAGAIAEVFADAEMEWALISNERGQGVLDLIFVSKKTGEILVVDAKGGGKPNLGKGAWIKSDEFPGEMVRGREGTTPYLVDRLRSQPGLGDKLKQLDLENGWNLQQILGPNPDLSKVRYQAIQTDPTGKIYTWEFEESIGPKHPDYVAPPGYTPKSRKHSPVIGAGLSDDLARSLMDSAGRASYGVAILSIGVPPFADLGAHHSSDRVDQSLQINISPPPPPAISQYGTANERLRVYAEIASL
ncbi:hypothetical protein [Nocardia sp. AG03]|uniref:hypothetical protein n=1 Tax=Nocardia sp. AG03 TaxID=3025312 RepID=UPI002418937E|nr:hypothetical protein [Nocardia sp. AG03]